MLRLVMKSRINNEAENYRRLTDNIRTKGTQRGDIKRDVLTEHGNYIGVVEIIMQNERQSLKLSCRMRGKV